MKSIRPIKSLSTVLLFSSVLALAGAAVAKDQSTAKVLDQAKANVTTRDTKEIGPDGLATERIVVTENNSDGTITRIVQVIHADGRTETRGERLAARQKG